MFKKILIANRGEIAIRIIRAAREMGIETVSVYCDVDTGSPYVQYSDYCIKLSGETPRSSYLDIGQIIDAARRTNAEAIHPGYGFLSENAEFAAACRDAGIAFIGPPPESIEAMGVKTKAREIVTASGVPVVPGTTSAIEDPAEAERIAGEIGYPVLIKAASGGGGKGMRRVDSPADFADSFEGARREALKSFGDGSVYLEKFIENPKHIEIQFIADSHGHYVHLGERDCSIQRRHQKVIEEAPSTVLDEVLRAKMGEVALQAARAVNYVNAGTVEFLFDRNKNFYFLEMNTRLQVEHPVTELATGIDIVKEQICVAWGDELSFKQEDVRFSGHALECRIYAEDPFNNFMPSTGVLSYVRQPVGYGVRVDSGIETGSEVTFHFDPMLAKLITFGKDRIEAIARMETALRNYYIKGVATTIPFQLAVMQHPEFRYGYFDTGFIERSFDFEALHKMKRENEETIAALAAFGYRMLAQQKAPMKAKPSISKWKEKNLLLRRLI